MNNPYKEFMNPVVQFYLLNHIYTSTRAIQAPGPYQGSEPLHSIYLAKQENEYPPIIIIDDDCKVNPQRTEYSLRLLELEEDINDYTVGLSPTAFKKIVKAMQENGATIPEDPTLPTELARSRICFKPIPRLRDPTMIEQIDWPNFVERLIRWDAKEKDPRLCLAHKTQILKGIEPRLNCNSLIVTNAGTGKSIHFFIHGTLIDKATKNAFLGYAKSPEEVYKGTVDGSELPIGIDQIELGNWGIMDFMFNVMEYGQGTVSSGAVKFTVKSRSPFSFIANPLSDRLQVEKGFGVILSHLTNNPAIGRRFGVIVYGDDYNILQTRSTPDSMDQWRLHSEFLRAVEEAATPELSKIMRTKGVWDWVNQPIHGYAERLGKIAEGCNEDTIRLFFTEHARAGQGRVKAAALQVSLLDYLPDILLKRYELNDLIEHAEETLPELTKLNLESAIRIAQNVGDEKRLYAEHWLDTSPEYLKHIVYAVEYARRSGILASSFNLGDLDYKPQCAAYTHISQCEYKLTKRKRGLAEFNARCKQYFGFSFRPERSHLVILMESRKPITWLVVPGYDDPGKPSDEVEIGHRQVLTLHQKEQSVIRFIKENPGASEEQIAGRTPYSADTKKMLRRLVRDGTLYEQPPGCYHVAEGS